MVKKQCGFLMGGVGGGQSENLGGGTTDPIQPSPKGKASLIVP